MVRCEKDKIVVEIESQFPADEWIEHVRDLVWAIGAINGELAEQERIYGLCQLVLELLPDEAAAREMIKAAGPRRVAPNGGGDAPHRF